MFEQTRELLEDYYCSLLARGATRRAEHLLAEVRGRLRELQWTHRRVLELEGTLVSESLNQLPAGQPRPDVLKLVFIDTERPDRVTRRHAYAPFGASDELRVLLEAFYYSAHRIRCILRECSSDLHGLRGFEAAGIRDVRNHLVEHPGGKSGVLVFSFAVGGPVGPQIKPIRWSEDPKGSFDKGLHHNAAEFEREVDHVLKRAIGECAK